MKWLGGLFTAVAILGSATAQAQQAAVTGTTSVSPAGLKTTYSIYSDYTTVTTVAAKTNQWDNQTTNFLFSMLRGSLQKSAFVTSVTQTTGLESQESNQWWDYELRKRRSHVFVTLSLQAPITLLFELDENYRKCKPPATTPVVLDESGYASACSRQSVLTVKGPIAVYGNFASSINVDALLRNKQEIEITLSKSYNKEDTHLATRFTVKTVSFDDGLSRFFRIFNIPVFLNHDNDVGYGSGALDKVSPLTSRQKLMLGVSRIARQMNERMLNP